VTFVQARCSSEGWIVLGCAALIICMGMGSLFALSVFVKPIEDAMAWSRSAISGIALVNWLAMGLGSFAWGALSDRFGTRIVALLGGVLLGLGLVLSSQIHALWQLYVTFGVVVGFSVGAFYAPLTATATRWFTANRGLAVGIVSAGIGLGILVVAPLARALITAYDWRTAFMLIGDLAWLVVIPASLLLRNVPAGSDTTAAGRAVGLSSVALDDSASAVLRTPQFWAIAVTHFACCTAHSGPIFHMVTNAMEQGVPKMTAATILGVSGLASIAGRLLAGMLADRFGAKQTLLAGLFAQAATVALYLVTRETLAFHALAVAFGVTYGGVMPLYALVVRSYFGDKVMGTAYGAVFMISTIGMGLGSFAGGYIHDSLGSYAWLYLGSAMAGAAAVALALTFRTPRAQLA
jgi:predicted MFS family arabinose efflux permease